MGSSDDSSSGSSDEECKNLPKDEKDKHKAWNKGVKKGTIAPGTAPPWKGGAAWVAPPRKAKSGKHSSGDKKHCSDDKKHCSDDKKHGSGEKKHGDKKDKSCGDKDKHKH